MVKKNIKQETGVNVNREYIISCIWINGIHSMSTNSFFFNECKTQVSVNLFFLSLIVKYCYSTSNNKTYYILPGQWVDNTWFLFNCFFIPDEDVTFVEAAVCLAPWDLFITVIPSPASQTELAPITSTRVVSTAPKVLWHTPDTAVLPIIVLFTVGCQTDIHSVKQDVVILTYHFKFDW